MDFVVSLIEMFSATPIYKNVEALSVWMLTHITPVLVVIAMWVRLMETQLDGFSGQSRYATAVRDFLWYGFLLSAYMALGALVSYAFNNFYGMLGEKGSFQVVFAQMQAFIEQINQMDKNSDVLGAEAFSLLTAPVTGISYLIYYISLIVVVFLLVIMRLALAVGYGLVFVWGLIAIPLTMTSKFKLLRGWGIFAAGILLWPVIEAILIWFFSPVLTAAAQDFVSGDASTFLLEKAGIYLLYTVLNLLIAAIIIASPLIAGALAANNSAMNSLVMPFAGAAMAASAATIKATQQRLFGGMKESASALGGSGMAQVASSKVESMARTMTGMGPAANSSASKMNSNTNRGRLAESLRPQASEKTSQAANNATSNPSASVTSDMGSSTAKKAVAAAAVHQAIDSTNTSPEQKTSVVDTQAQSQSQAQDKNETSKKRTRSGEDARRAHFIDKNLKNRGDR